VNVPLRGRGDTYYNENDPFAADWLEGLIKGNQISNGTVDRRSIKDVKANDLSGVRRAHFFAGIGGWDLALKLAGWPADRPVWTGSCPCQPFSSAGRMRGFKDDRHLWPVWKTLIEECQPPIVFGEQIAHAKVWFDQVCSDLEGMDYTFGAAVLPAISVGFRNFRYRIFFVAHPSSKRLEGLHAKGRGINLQSVSEDVSRLDREAHPGVLTRIDGFSRKLDKPFAYKNKVVGFGNAINPVLAAEFIKAVMEI
jgi:site-specific DNA-cytosine methylase